MQCRKLSAQFANQTTAPYYSHTLPEIITIALKSELTIRFLTIKKPVFNHTKAVFNDFSKTLNGRLPPKIKDSNKILRSKPISDDPQHLIFRRRQLFFWNFFGSENSVFRSFDPVFEELRRRKDVHGTFTEICRKIYGKITEIFLPLKRRLWSADRGRRTPLCIDAMAFKDLPLEQRYLETQEQSLRWTVLVGHSFRP